MFEVIYLSDDDGFSSHYFLKVCEIFHTFYLHRNIKVGKHARPLLIFDSPVSHELIEGDRRVCDHRREFSTLSIIRI